MKDFEVSFINEFSVKVRFLQNPSEQLLSSLIYLKSIFIKSKLPFLDTVNVAYNSVSLSFLPNVNFNHMIVLESISDILSLNFEKNRINLDSELKKNIEIPTLYNGEDLELVAETLKLSTSDVILLHTEPIYTVAMIGFLPGFPYLMGINSKLQMPRKTNPRSRVKKGSVAIAGLQTGIYPLESPGGWQIIGNTDISLFNDGNTHSPCLLSAGDKIKFRAI